MLSLTQREFLEKILYVLSQTEGLDYYRLFKVLYFAERECLATTCRPLVADDFYHLPHGPVPSRLYDTIKGGRKDAFAEAFAEVVAHAGEDAPTVLLARRSPDMDYLSPTEQEILDRAIRDYAPLSFAQLKALSHGRAWQDTAHCAVISPEAIAQEGGLSTEALPYLRERLAWHREEHDL